MMLIDTDVLIWNLRGNERAREFLDAQPQLQLSAVTYMELVQGLRNKAELKALRQAMHYWEADIEPISEAVSSRAMYLVEEYSLSHGLQLADALIASTAITIGETLVTANDKHYRFIDNLEIEVFRP
ncbi:type II toxin-antitoxin system VapC family toxin [Marinimicrobium agarilyticum]|uniref:type II toxin-antitoxin system VapC family toxin n=1 Tax=Marinimicrobium agarilyticum TaxID=306546 RepID=UPI00041A9316|nr:type II toxin-antitoxin system VapC family toxin [Marinimicrobium agarilyticum]